MTMYSSDVAAGDDGQATDLNNLRKDLIVGANNIVTATDGATVTFDLEDGKIQEVTLGGNRTLALSNVTVGQLFILNLIQDATGGRIPTWFSTIKWADGVTPTPSSGANKIDSYGFLCRSTGNYLGFVLGQNM